MHKILSHKSLIKSCKLSIWPIRFVQAPASHHRVLPVSIPLSAASSLSAAQSINPVLQRPQGKQEKKISPRSSGRGVNRWRGKKCPLQRRIITMGEKTTRVLNRAHSQGGLRLLRWMEQVGVPGGNSHERVWRNQRLCQLHSGKTVVRHLGKSQRKGQGEKKEVGCIQFPVAAVTNDHKLGDLKQQNFLFSWLGDGGRSLTSRWQRAVFPPGAPGKTPSCLFQLLVTAGLPRRGQHQAHHCLHPHLAAPSSVCLWLLFCLLQEQLFLDINPI